MNAEVIVRKAIERHFGVTEHFEITGSLYAAPFDADSLDLIELVLDLEEFLSMDLLHEDLAMETIAEIPTLIIAVETSMQQKRRNNERYPTGKIQ